jgi:hypothetical protein
LRGEYEAIELLPTQSPFAAADVSAANYAGEFVGLPLDVKGGSWLYDRVRNELVYVPNLQRHLHVADDVERATPRLRYRLELLKSSNTTYVGVSLRPTGGARWEPLP